LCVPPGYWWFHATIGEEQVQAIPVFGNVFQGLAGWGFGRDLRLVLGWAYFICFQLWLCAFNASGKARIGGLVFDLGFDPVESGDLFQAFLHKAC